MGSSHELYVFTVFLTGARLNLIPYKILEDKFRNGNVRVEISCLARVIGNCYP